MLPGVEVRELIDTIKDIADQLLEVEPRCDADLATKTTGHRSTQISNGPVIDQAADPLCYL